MFKKITQFYILLKYKIINIYINLKIKPPTVFSLPKQQSDNFSKFLYKYIF
jgi:hypothetical protein